MSIFASQTIKTVPILRDPSQTVTVRKLSGKQLDAAQFAHMVGIATGRGRNWATTFAHLAAAGKATDADAEKVLRDPLTGFDRLTLCKGGVTAWSYVTPKGEPMPVTPEAIDDLEDEALEQFATDILQLTKPELFQTSEEQADARKNG